MKNWRSQIAGNGPLLIGLSVICFSTMNLGVKAARESFRADTLLFYRSVIQCAMLLPWLSSYYPPNGSWGWAVRWKAHFFRGLFGVFSIWSLYASLRYLPLGMVTLLTASSILWSLAIAWVILQERPTPRQLVWTVVIVVGLAGAVWNPTEGRQWTFHLFGVLMALLCGFFTGAALTHLKKLRNDYGSREIVFYFGLTCLLFVIPAFATHPEWPHSARDWGLLLQVGIGGTLGQVLMTAGFRHTTTLVGTLGSLQQAPLNILVGWALLSERPPFNFFVGSVAIIVGIAGLLRAAGRRAPVLKTAEISGL